MFCCSIQLVFTLTVSDSDSVRPFGVAYRVCFLPFNLTQTFCVELSLCIKSISSCFLPVTDCLIVVITRGPTSLCDTTG